MNPIPLSAPDGQVYGYACSHCHHIGGGSSLLCPPESDGPHEDLVEASLWDARQCCLCRDCGDVIPLDWWGLWCRPCDAYSRFCQLWGEIATVVTLEITSLEQWERWISRDREEEFSDG